MSLDQENLSDFSKSKKSSSRRKTVISDPSHFVRVFDEHGLNYVFERVDSPEEIDTPMKIDWDLAKTRFTLGYARGLSDEVKLVKMSPDQYLTVAPMPYDIEGFPDERSISSITKGIKDGSTFDTPYLLIDFKNRIVGQEGRHRALALQRLGVKEMPCAIVLKV